MARIEEEILDLTGKTKVEQIERCTPHESGSNKEDVKTDHNLFYRSSLSRGISLFNHVFFIEEDQIIL